MTCFYLSNADHFLGLILILIISLIGFGARYNPTAYERPALVSCVDIFTYHIVIKNNHNDTTVQYLNSNLERAKKIYGYDMEYTLWIR